LLNGSVKTAAAATSVNVDTRQYHYDPAHSGYNPATPAFTKAVKSWSAQLDGVVQGSPLVVNGLVIAATEHNTVYGLNRTTGRVRWSRNLGSPVNGSTLPCGNINPLGITGTPVADSTHLFVVTTTPLGTSIRHTLVGMDPTTGAVRSRTAIDPANQDPRVENQRAALSIAKGRVVVYSEGWTETAVTTTVTSSPPRSPGRNSARTPSDPSQAWDCGSPPGCQRTAPGTFTSSAETAP